MDDTPFINDGADTSLRKTVSLLNKIEAKTGSTTITGPVTVSNEVEVKNDSGNPVPVKVKDSAGADVSYITAGIAGDPSPNVVSVQGITSGVGINTIPDVVSIAQGIQYQLDHVGAITRPEDVGAGIQYYLDNYGNNIPVVEANSTDIHSDTTTISSGLGLPTDPAATTDTNTFTIFSFIKRGMQNWTSLLAKIPALVSGRIPVDGSGVTQPISVSSLPLPSGASTAAKQPALGTAGTPSSDVITVQGASGGTALNTKEIQPIGDYVINVGAAGVLSLSGSGSAVSTSGFDAGATAEYVVVTIEGGGPAGGLYIDGSLDNTYWTSGQYINVYYDTPATSATESYSYRNVAGQLFGATRSAYNARFIISCAHGVAFTTANQTYRYFRITAPAGYYGSWRYKFASYKSPVYSIGGANAGGVTRVNGRVDVGYVSNLPTLSATVTQSTATSLRSQAEAYQGGTAVGSANPLQVTLANTSANATAVKVDGSAVTQPVSGTFWQATQPVSGTVTINNSQGATVTQSTFTSTTASTSLVAASANRKTLTVFNEGSGVLYVSVGSTCTTTAYQVRLSSGDYWECPSNQTSLAHTAVFATSGNARVTEVV